MGFRKRNANKSDNRSKAKVVMGKPASQLTKEDKKILSARIAEIKSANGGKTTVQNTIPYMCMYKDGVCQVSENFFSMTVQFYDANYSISEFEEQNNIFSKYCDVINFICPSSLKFNKADFEIGNAYGAVWGMNILAGELSDEILKDFLEMQNLFCVNIHVDPLDQIDALKFVKKKLTNVEQMKIDEQKKASQSGYDPDILPPAIKMYIEDIEKLLADLNSKNERLFHISISLRAYAKSKKELKLLSEMLKRVCQGFSV